MKKILLFAGICFMLFSCKQDKNFKDPNMAALAKSKNIPHDKAEAMKKHFKDPGKTPKFYDFHWDLYNALVELNGAENVYIVPVRYYKADEADYCTAWEFPNNDPRCAVENYSSLILQVGTNTDYYEFATICPPPSSGDCSWVQKK